MVMSKIKITYDGLAEEKMTFERVVKFKLKLDDYRGNLDKEGQRLLDEICHWCSNQFSKNFVIMEYASIRIAGGFVDNKGSWPVGTTVDRSEYAWQSEYELRCMLEDHTWFLLRWS
jgi:hypothetical protein